MVDINLIGDDKTGEEGRVDDFTQTSSMDTQELAFEERTETFDTTKTAGFAQKRSYSSVVSTLIIIAVIVLLGSAVYFFMFGDEENPAQTDLASFDAALSEQGFDDTAQDPELDQLTQDFAQDLSDVDLQDSQFEDLPSQAANEPERQFEPDPVVTQPPARSRSANPTPSVARDVIRGSSPIASISKDAVQAVTNLLNSMPANLNMTLLSYTGNRVRLEFVANTSSEAKDFTGRLNQYFNSGRVSVISEGQVASNSGPLEKVLVAGSMGTNGSAANNQGVQFLNLDQAKSWIRTSSKQLGLSVRDLTTQQSDFSDGYQKTPFLVRLYGTQTALVGFLQELTTQSYNFELAKILLVSPDMVSYSDDNLILVLNMFLYEQS